jgi:hypothetical protein
VNQGQKVFRDPIHACLRHVSTKPHTINLAALTRLLASGAHSACLIVGLIFALSSTCCFGGSRLSTDIVYMRNGDKITGEIKSLNQGQLSIKPDYALSPIQVDWAKVDRLESKQLFIVTDPNGNTYTGALTKGPGKDMLKVTSSASTDLRQESVVSIDQLGNTFFKRLRGNVDLGTNVTRSNSQANMTLQSGLSYQSQRYLYSMNASSQVTTQKEVANTNETTLKNSLFRQLRKSNWYGTFLANFLSSSAQEVDLRSTLGGGIARRLIYTNHTDLTALAGLGYTTDKLSHGATTPHPQSLDSALAAKLSIFRFDKATFDSTLWVYPSLTARGRLRLTFNQDVYYKLPKNFYVRASFFDNYDNEPVPGALSNNVGASSSIGWSFP